MLSTQESNLASRAKALLERGAMPLLPPAPRQWSTDEAVTLTGPSGSFKWSPRGYQDGSADRRRQAFEFVAMNLDLAPSGLPATAPGELYDKCNFLFLPGSAKVHRSHEQQRPVMNFSQLRSMVVTGKGGLRFLLMLQRASDLRDETVDRHLAVVSHVPLWLL